MKKYIILLLVITPLLIHSQTFKSYGLYGGYSFDGKGWENPDTIGSYYHNKVFIKSINLGAYGEFLSKKHFSTMVDVGLKFRQYHFEYDNPPNPDDARLIDNTMYYITAAVYEKFKMDIDKWSLYLYGGINTGIRFNKSVEKDIQDIFENSKSFNAGTTAGIGFRKRIARFLSISFDLYYERDFTKMYESSSGFIRNSEIGFKIGLGPFNPASK